MKILIKNVNCEPKNVAQELANIVGSENIKIEKDTFFVSIENDMQYAFLKALINKYKQQNKHLILQNP